MVNGDIIVVVSPTEVARLAIAISVGTEAISRAEYFIRSGLSKPLMEQVAAALEQASKSSNQVQRMEIDGGIETVENPPRERPLSP